MDASNFGSESLAHGNVTVTTTAATPTIVRQDLTQRSLMIFNNSTTITAYVGNSAISTTNGYPIPPGDSVTLNTRSPVYIITASSTADIRWISEVA
jgi:hypothetical protein